MDENYLENGFANGRVWNPPLPYVSAFPKIMG
jgi:hypothetical protein